MRVASACASKTSSMNWELDLAKAALRVLRANAHAGSRADHPRTRGHEEPLSPPARRSADCHGSCSILTGTRVLCGWTLRRASGIEYRAPDSIIAIGKVSTHASTILRIVDSCRPDSV